MLEAVRHFTPFVSIQLLNMSPNQDYSFSLRTIRPSELERAAVQSDSVAEGTVLPESEEGVESE